MAKKNQTHNQAAARKTALALSVLVCSMGAVAFFSPTLYDAFCRLTGYGGTPTIIADKAFVHGSEEVDKKIFTIRFEADISHKLNWQFEPQKEKISLRAGEVVVAYYKARNQNDRMSKGTAVYNVTPHKVAPYVAKVDCFCFEEQTLAAQEEVLMPIRFTIDPAIFEDPSMQDVYHVTFSYVFYPSEDEATREMNMDGHSKSNL